MAACKLNNKLLHRLACAAALMATLNCAQAGDLALLINGKAIHFEAPAGTTYNERNWGAGVQYDFDPVAGGRWVPFLSASGFKDSIKNPSYYAGGGMLRRYRFGPSDGAHIDLGGIAFLMTRKDVYDGRPFFGVLPVASIGNDRVALNMTFIPKVDPKMVPLVFLQLKVVID